MGARTTSWGGVADWYNDYLETGEDTYQKKVILPNLLRLIGSKKGQRIIDIACGQGYFSRAFAEAGMTVVGADISPELLRTAQSLGGTDVTYYTAPADKLAFAKKESFDVATIVLAIQNIENLFGACDEAARVLTVGGRLYIVMMHPVLRVPKASSWGFDDETKTQYRRVDTYLSQKRVELIVHPGKEKSPVTVSYHRSLQDYSKALAKAGLAITKIEEWISHKESQKGPRQSAENTSRKEIPLFMMIEATKL